MSSSSTPSLDFESLLSRDHRPARLTQLNIREKFDALEYKKIQKKRLQNNGSILIKLNNHTKNPSEDDGVFEAGGGISSSAGGGLEEADTSSRLVRGLVSNTGQYSGYFNVTDSDDDDDENDEDDSNTNANANKKKTNKTKKEYESLQRRQQLVVKSLDRNTFLPPSFHQIEVGDWEKNIIWTLNDNNNNSSIPHNNNSTTTNNNIGSTNNAGPQTLSSSTTPPNTILSGTNASSSSGRVEPSSTSNATTNGAANSSSSADGTRSDSEPIIPDGMDTAAQLLQQRRNPFLENLNLDSICWTTQQQQQPINVPLLLELGVAGQSVARQKIPPRRPTPGIKSDGYQTRLEDELQISSTAELGKTGGSLHENKEKREALIQARQKKRAQMAKDKTNRVTEAMGTLAIGGGKGRTITSSLMGPGGTERTGRPSRHMGSSAAHEFDYVEQLDMITSHQLVRDLSKVLLRQYHRPKLPLSILRNLSWQFQIKYQPSLAKKAGSVGGAHNGGSSSYSQIMLGNHQFAGAVSKAKLRNEADLSPSEGKLVLLEYCEERPPVQLTKGMCVKVVNYYRGDKSRCPVSAGGGDRPTRRKNKSGSGDSSEETNDNKEGKKDGEDGNGDGDDDNNNNLNKSKKLSSLSSDGPDKFLQATVMDWIGKIAKSSKEDRNGLNEAGGGKNKNSINILPEGVTEILHPKVHGPFIGEVEEAEEGTTLTGLISNLFVAPMFRHEPEQTDFLMILGRNSGGGVSRPGVQDHLGVILREFPTSVFTVGQTEPRTRVFAPGTQGEKNFIAPFVSYQIAKTLARTQMRDGQGLRFDEIQKMVLPNLELPSNALRQRLKYVAIYDKNTQIWTTKATGWEDYPGVEALGKSISPEGVAAYETACSAQQRLTDLGLHHLFSGSHAVSSVGVVMVYLAGQLNFSRELSKKMRKRGDFSRNKATGVIKHLQTMFYEKANSDLEAHFKALKMKVEVATFIYEELQLAPWHLTGEFIEVHKKAEGTGMMQLTGIGDPSGKGEGFNFLRELDSKPSKSVGNAQLSAQVKKITGTEDDLRKLTMKQMASLLRSYGMQQKQIDTLKRWDRVHVIRDLSTKAASDGIGDGLERFARGEKMKLSEQKEMYRKRIQEIWRRQIEALSNDAGGGGGPYNRQTPGGGGGAAAGGGGSGTGGDGTGMDADGKTDAGGAPQQAAAAAAGNLDSESDSDDDDFMLSMENELMGTSETNQIVADYARDKTGNNGDMISGNASALGQLRAVHQDQDLTKDARELAALKRQLEEDRAAMAESRGTETGASDYNIAQGNNPTNSNRKVIRKRIVKTHPDGTHKITFKFIVRPEEVKKITAKIEQKKAKSLNPKSKKAAAAAADLAALNNPNQKFEYDRDERPLGHSMFEDEDDFDFAARRVVKARRTIAPRTRKDSPRGGFTSNNNNKDSGSVGGGGGGSVTGRLQPRGPKTLQYGKSKNSGGTTASGTGGGKGGNSSISSIKEQKLKNKRKREREEEEAELYTSASKRKGTNNRRERGSIRDRRPHVIFAEKLEQIRTAAEKRPLAGPFLKPVSRKHYPQYYERISSPIDLATIRDKIMKYEYRTADAFLRDFELMKLNAIKFNGSTNQIAVEGTAIYEMVKELIEGNKSELDKVAEQVKEQMSEGKPKKKKKKGKKTKGTAAAAATPKPAPAIASPTATTTVEGDIPEDFVLDSDSDTDFLKD